MSVMYSRLFLMVRSVRAEIISIMHHRIMIHVSISSIIL
jgi:hypothetical protein